MRTRILLLAGGIAWLILAGCQAEEGRPAIAAGTGSETTNHIAGLFARSGYVGGYGGHGGYDGYGGNGDRQVRQWSEGAGGVRVLLVPEDFDPVSDTLPAAARDTTSEQGRYLFTSPRRGAYRVEAYHPWSGLRALVDSFAYDMGPLDLGRSDLQLPGYLHVLLPESLWRTGGWIFIPGTTYKAEVGESRVTTFHLPPMRVPSIVYTAAKEGPRQVLAREVPVLSFAITEVIVPASPTAVGDTLPAFGEAVFRINTTTAGAGVPKDVAGFPLLLRLDSANFDFRPGRPSAFAFFDDRGTELDWELDRWDGPGRRAELWVRMDTVKGNSSAQTLRMRWGYGTPVGRASNGARVFRSSEGFSGVWHLDAPGGGGVAPRGESTGNGRDATVWGYDGDESVEGAIGDADRLDAFDDRLDLGIFNLDQAATLSMWVKAGPLTSAPQRILHKHSETSAPGPSGAAYGIQMEAGSRTPRGGVWVGWYHYCAPFGPVQGGWDLLTFTWNDGNFSAYLNGAFVQGNGGIANSVAEMNLQTTTVGPLASPGWAKFAGAVDEIRFERRARGPEWIRLCYENQKPAQALLVRER